MCPRSNVASFFVGVFVGCCIEVFEPRFRVCVTRRRLVVVFAAGTECTTKNSRSSSCFYSTTGSHPARIPAYNMMRTMPRPTTQSWKRTKFSRPLFFVHKIEQHNITYIIIIIIACASLSYFSTNKKKKKRASER